MGDLFLASAAVALFSLIFSSVPFVQLIYILVVVNVTTWDSWILLTFLQIMATYGATVWRKLKD
jgi:hypothetical protein